MTTIAKERKDKWGKQIKCYYEECLTCQRACRVHSCKGETAFSLETCTKKHGEPVQYPYLLGKTPEEIIAIKKEIKKNGTKKH